MFGKAVPSKNFVVKDAILDPLVSSVYTFKKEIGEGAFSKVYQAEHNKTHKAVAIKHIDKRQMKDDKSWRRLQNEVSFLKECVHPNVLQLYEVYISDSHISLVTEFCQGGDLFEKIYNESPFPEVDAAKIFKQIMTAVQFLHNKGIAHRDLKPENILFRTTEVNSPVVLADFGFSYKNDTREKFMHSDVGTPDYAAPEILRLSYTNGVDIWACGCILYCMLFGLPPFCADSGAETLRKITRGDAIEFYDDVIVSEDAKALILGMLNRNTSERLTAQQVLNHTWLQEYCPKPVRKNMLSRKKSVAHENTRAFRHAFHVVIERECKEAEDIEPDTDDNVFGPITFGSQSMRQSI